MTPTAKISPALSTFASEAGAGQRRDAIVIVRTGEPPAVRVRGRLRVLKERMDAIKKTSRGFEAARKGIAADLRKTGPSRAPVEVEEVGAKTLPVFSVQATPESLQTIAERPDVVAVLPNFRLKPIRPLAVKYGKPKNKARAAKLTWGLEELNVRKLWETTKGKDINVAVLDTGVHADHPALKNRVKGFLVFDPLGRRITTSMPFDADQHGTHVCGTIAGGTTADGIAIGVAPQCNLLVGGVLVGIGTLRTLVEGISWAVEQGADIVSMSLGFPYYEPLFSEIFQILIDQFGILPVAAIGNENYGNSSSPGNAYSTLSVGAAEKLSDGRVDVAFFSSGASLVFPNDPAHPVVTKPDVCAPGVDVYSAIPPEQRSHGVFEYNYMSGTSMATPHAAGIAALLMAAQPEASVHEIIKAVTETARHPGGAAQRPDNRWGWGFIQPLEAMQALTS
jgi:subtilisin family serine protease